MNALYGFTAAGKYPLLPDPTLAEFICFMGRTMNEQCCVYAEEYGADVIYGDTDSIMITREFNEPGMTDDQKRRAMWALAEKVMAKVNANVRYPCCIIVEKVFDPYLLISKKHYDGFKYEDLNKPGVRCSRGIETVRTDTPTLVQRLMDEVLDAMMAARSVHVIPDIVKRYIADLLYGRVPIDHLVVYKGMRARFASRTPVQVVCEQLDAHGQPRPYVGDKVPILVRRERFTGEGITERASHPTLVAPTDIDYAYYAEMCLQVCWSVCWSVALVGHTV
jgi:DNA polymerase elongation subunit (family B)